MMDCPKKLLDEMQNDIDSFILRSNSHWISKERIHLDPCKGGIGAINLSTYATSLRCSWYKRVNNGLWSDILMEKVSRKENIHLVKEDDIHKMHIAVRPIARALEELQRSYHNNYREDVRELNKPLHGQKVKIRNQNLTVNKTNYPFLYNKNGICEISARDITDPRSTNTEPRLKSNDELLRILNKGNNNYFENIVMINKTRELWKKLMDKYSFKHKLKHTNLKELFEQTKKGSRNYKNILNAGKNAKIQPMIKMNEIWNTDEKYREGNFYRKAFQFWKTSFLPTNLQNLHLQIINHKLKMNDQLKHFAKDENNVLVKGDCTFCTLNLVENPEEETYKHIFTQCHATQEPLITTARKYNIELPDADENGEQIIYFFPQNGKWKEIRTNIFLLIFKNYINVERLRKNTPTSEGLEKMLKNETRKMALTNPSNKELVNHLLPIWQGRELTETEILEVLQEYEGNEGKGRIMMDVNKRTKIINTKMHNGYNFPIKQGMSGTQRLYDMKNGDKFKQKLIIPTVNLS